MWSYRLTCVDRFESDRRVRSDKRVEGGGKKQIVGSAESMGIVGSIGKEGCAGAIRSFGMRDIRGGARGEDTGGNPD